MATLAYLDSHNFELRSNGKQKYFCLKMPVEWVLVYYYTSNCVHCQKYSPFFQQLPYTLHGELKFAICDAKKMLETIKHSLETTTPITSVPYIMLYKNGWPVKKYEGPADVRSLQNFFNTEKASSTSSREINVAAPEEFIAPRGKAAPQTCYLSYDEAYVAKTPQPRTY